MRFSLLHIGCFSIGLTLAACGGPPSASTCMTFGMNMAAAGEGQEAGIKTGSGPGTLAGEKAKFTDMCMQEEAFFKKEFIECVVKGNPPGDCGLRR